jgi:hypothetical protein
MIKLKNILSEQDNKISEKEWSKVEKVITRGMDMAFDKGVKYLLKNKFQKINKHLATKGFLKR